METYQAVIERAAAAREATDADTANRLALDLALVAIDAGHVAADLELHRKDLLHGIRDRVMQERSLAKTPAEEVARSEGQYLEYCQRIASLSETAERAKVWSRYFGTRARLLAMAQAVGA
ncbi:MAG TPA: hypothetical protein VFI96_04735 [Longimicrobiaceae bacterium]|nr:hypothetical protein [Longimicrobiaceae bacterium]